MKKKLKKLHKIVCTFRKERKKSYNKLFTNLAKLFAALVVIISATACNVTRVITNESQYLQKGDTSVVIQTKTIETYDATKKF